MGSVDPHGFIQITDRDEIPKTSVGKFDKKVRSRFAAGEISLIEEPDNSTADV